MATCLPVCCYLLPVICLLPVYDGWLCMCVCLFVLCIFVLFRYLLIIFSVFIIWFG